MRELDAAIVELQGILKASSEEVNTKAQGCKFSLCGACGWYYLTFNDRISVVLAQHGQLVIYVD